MCAFLNYNQEDGRCPQSGSAPVVNYEPMEGELSPASFVIFPGITLTYQDIHGFVAKFPRAAGPNAFEICHCREGRMERHSGEEFYYLTPGDLSIARLTDEDESYFPIGHYNGISILIDPDIAPHCLSCILDDVNVCPATLVQKFCTQAPCVVMRANESVEHIFSELYSVPESIRKGYLKVKMLELLLFLSGMEPNREIEGGSGYYSRAQVQLAKSICKYLTEHMNSRITIQQLADQFNVSQTQIKNSFKGVYGDSVYSFIRTQKMQAAAHYLRETDDTILEVAGLFGYDNASKFAKAFKDVIGVSPNEFRTFSG